MGKMFSGITIIPSTVVVSVLVVFPPMPMESAIKTRECGDDCRDLIGVGYVIIRLSLIKVVDSGLIDRFTGKSITISSTAGLEYGYLPAVAKFSVRVLAVSIGEDRKIINAQDNSIRGIFISRK